MEDLKGKAIGVTRYGSNTDISARFAIRKAGLQPEKDVALIQLEDYPGIIGGIRSGRIAAGALADPFTDYAKKLGYKEITDIAALGLEFPFVGIVAKKSYLKDNPNVAQRFVRAYTEAIALYKNNPELAMKVTSKYTGIKDPAILSSTVNFYAPKLARVPYPTIGGNALRARADRDSGSRRRRTSIRNRSWTCASSSNSKTAALFGRSIRKDSLLNGSQ